MSEIKWIKLSVGLFDNKKIEVIETLPEADTLIVIWLKLLTMAGKSNAGGSIMLTDTIPYTEDQLISLMNRPITTVRAAFNLFKQYGMIEIWEDGRVYLSSWEKHQNVDGMERIRELDRNRKRKQREKQRALLLQESGNSHVTVTGQVTESDVTNRDSHATDIDIDIDIEKDNTLSHQKYDEGNVYFQMALYFHRKVMEHAEANKVAHLIRKPNMQNWSDDFRKIIELDKRDTKELQTVIDWCTTNSFWSSVVLSPKKLREKYTELGLQMKRKPSSNTANRTDANKDLLRRRMEEVQNESEGDTSNPFLALNGVPDGNPNG
ncbi:phage replisome organizer N-terminal domain-containing protein [Paenibacillus alvei]|uniref:Phage replisome organizer N-terminal domain-containing protein n=1 Tax=Paenibacillus alvei TaxID=44250 RepID=A0ABT4H1Q0_PAEAL|nr:phage replisome organizer N-terminal domain-containing protein [Paenibacillus alvei]EJW19189.1 putative phage protein [Paenibacillus alvei DSM 29]EJW20046.1 hypothetical protein PAV_1c10420 [Paenibacillus alvei DSM 29]MCY9539062.1 phage replisome organizer N-terminal domain-containing protein [Paenibacillus alvei]MCY9708638.1 phage replisome organizer N-terminal domain-containing protein [Paenibacillus alvei]MCY9738263.1 phage replisome organizer N-terminal domain-containing protein [Paenib